MTRILVFPPTRRRSLLDGVYAARRRSADPSPLRAQRGGEGLGGGAGVYANRDGHARPIGHDVTARALGEHARGHVSVGSRGVDLQEEHAHDHDVDENREDYLEEEPPAVAARDDPSLAEHLAQVVLTLQPSSRTHVNHQIVAVGFVGALLVFAAFEVDNGGINLRELNLGRRRCPVALTDGPVPPIPARGHATDRGRERPV
mmetsp:Transcript_10624/g.44078  ORF Transcript_10624/g.44078 Transcript_10624/m.44078 type:complete len:202 (-) Transcript_10624:53-658(-)